MNRIRPRGGGSINKMLTKYVQNYKKFNLPSIVINPANVRWNHTNSVDLMSIADYSQHKFQQTEFVTKANTYEQA
jgi:hypothetical protein